MKIESFKINHDDPVLNEEAFSSYQKNGFVILKNFITETEVLKIKKIVECLAQKELENETGHIYGENLQRVWNLLNKHLIFHELLLSRQIDLWMNKIFDRDTRHQKYFLSSIQANILKPGAKAQILHTDTPIPEPIPPYTIKANSIWLLDDFTDKNGATEVIPGSHTSSKRPPREPTTEEYKRLIRVIAPKGSVLITSGNLWHRSGDNKSSDSRTVLLGSFAASYIREIACEDDTVRFLTDRMRLAMNPKLLEIIGGNHGSKPGNIN
jgi:ectoine hydroxylase-related dioxygenase (phytanoyl-CoA dioxygenase family)